MVRYRLGSFTMLPKRYSVEGKLIGPRNPNEAFQQEHSDRTWRPQKYFFQFNLHRPRDGLEYKSRRAAYEVERKLINLAFDMPDQIPVFLRDLVVEGFTEIFSDGEQWMDTIKHWVAEGRYWRCLGIQDAFYDNTTLRAHCWAHKGTDVGNLMFSRAMVEAIMDMERARKRKEMGLEPNYVWDRWGPVGFVDGALADYLPRYKFNPYVDPDGVNVTEEEVAPYVTHEQLKERYKDFIEPERPADGTFLSPSHSCATLNDLHPRAASLYRAMHGMETAKSEDAEQMQAQSPDGDMSVEPQHMRTLCYLSAIPSLMNAVSGARSWGDVEAVVSGTRNENDMKIDAARMMYNSGHKDQIRRFFEEKCGWQDYLLTPDRKITGAVLSFFDDLSRVVSEPAWGKHLCLALADREKLSVMGDDAFAVFRHIEDIALERRRKLWATRFSGDPNDERTLDYILEGLGQRRESMFNADQNVYGEEFDREYEPIGRHVQRRVLSSDVTQPKVPRFMQKKKLVDPLEGLHQQQVMKSGHV